MEKQEKIIIQQIDEIIQQLIIEMDGNLINLKDDACRNKLRCIIIKRGFPTRYVDEYI